jgi:anti-sigma-K factor RskA
MPEAKTNGDARYDNLAWQALLYASGELDAAQTADFEHRLGNDQEAREALTVAVQLAQIPGASSTVAPSPAYRQRVHQQLERGTTFWGNPWGKRAYRGHPLFWSLAGAAVMALLIVGIGQSAPRSATEHATKSTADSPAAEPDDVESSQVASSMEEAYIWADLSQNDHLLKAHDEETRRRLRTDEWHRLLRSDARRSRSPMNPCN